MALMLRDGDYVSDGAGGLRTVQGREELLERVLWKLTVCRGSFPFLPELGSRLHLLGRAKPSQRESLAREYVTEALSDEPVEVASVVLTMEPRPLLTVELLWQRERLRTELELGGME